MKRRLLMLRALAAAAVAAGAVLSLVGCPGKLADPERFSQPEVNAVSDVPTCLSTVFSKKCSGDLCHSPGTPGAGLDLVSSGVGARLIGVPATHGDADGGVCPPATLIDPNNPSASWILYKIGASVDCGSPMPQVGKLSNAERQCINDFVTAVAADSGAPMGSGGASGSGGAAGSSGAGSGGVSGSSGTAGASGSAGSGGASGGGGAAGSSGGGGLGGSGGSAGSATAGGGGGGT